MSSPRRRIETDIHKLLMTDHEVDLVEDSFMEFHIKFHGPKDSPYEGGVWKVHVQLPDAYPYKSPSIGFVNKIFHPNIDEMSGSVCLDVINQTWSPMYELLNIFEVFLPQLLIYPNAADPLNGEAAALLMNNPDEYKTRVKEYVKRFATEEGIVKAEQGPGGAGAGAAAEDEDDDDLSSVGSMDSDDDAAGDMDL